MTRNLTIVQYKPISFVTLKVVKFGLLQMTHNRNKKTREKV